MNSLNNIERYIDTFNKIESWMRKEVLIEEASRHSISHSKLIDKLSLQNPYVKQYSSRLHAFRSLRNALVHWPKASDGQAIAEPHKEIVDEYVRIFDKLTQPPLILQIAVPITKVFSVHWKDCISSALKEMVQNNYRQVPIVRISNGLCYLEGIFDFFHYGQISVQQCKQMGAFTLHDTDTFETYKPFLLLDDDDAKHAIKVCSKELTVLDAENIFVHHFQRDMLLTSILITEDGTHDSPFIGMLTAHDIPSLSGKMEPESNL